MQESYKPSFQSCSLCSIFNVTALLKLSLSLSYGLRISPERIVSIFMLCYIFSCSLQAPVLCLFTLSDSLVSFYNLSFSSVVPSLEYRHSLYSETRLVRATPDQKLASVSCTARSRLVRQHLIKTIG